MTQQPVYPTLANFAGFSSGSSVSLNPKDFPEMNTDLRVAPTVASQGKHNLHHIFAYWHITAHFAINDVQTQRNNETNSCKSKFRAIKINVKLANTRAVGTVRKPAFPCRRIKQASSDIPNRLYFRWKHTFNLANSSVLTVR